MRKFNTLTFNNDSWLIQEIPTNKVNLSIYKNGIKTDYFLVTVFDSGITCEVIGYKLYDSSKGRYDFIEGFSDTEINFNLMVKVVNTITRITR